MSLLPGSRFGVYEVIAIVGRGGMGEVYRARDTRLERDVALKVLPDGEVSDPQWRARFEREARALASLNHPNIAAIYGFEEDGPARGEDASAIVMELVEGETLAERLARGPLPLDAALAIAAQVADALEAAHQRGIAHRDLKPANVKITPAGTVKVLDFGLAKFLADPAHEGATRSGATAPAVLLGTPAYMAPEQVEGKSVDRRADVWAFGVVLYEMLTGDSPFRGDSMTGTLTAVLSRDPDWDRVPTAVRPLLRACLERDPARRLRDIADYRFLLSPPASPAAGVPRSRARSLVLAATALAGMVAAFLAGQSIAPNDSAAAPVVRLSTMLPAGVSVTRGPGYTSSVAVSPDGTTIVIAASDKDGQRLYRRTLDRLEPTPIAGTEGGSSPFFSWDGEWIGFFADGRLKRIPAAGGAAIDVAAAPGHSGGASWGPDGHIVFAYGADSHLYVVPGDGGDAQRLAGETQGRQPDVLPDGRTVLFEAAGHIHAVDRQTGTITKLLPGTAPRYANGHVIFSRGTTMLAAPFHIGASSPGTVTAVAEDVAVELPGSGGGRHYAISRNGTLVYVPAAGAYELVVIGADGSERLLGEPLRSLENPRFSPDGRHVVVASRRRDDEPTDLWVHDLASGTNARLTFDGGRAPYWNANEATITYSHLGKGQGIYTTRVDGGGDRRQVLALDGFHWLVGSVPDRAMVVYGLMDGAGGSSIIAHGPAGPRTVVETGSIWGGRLSRDGRWLAYYVLASGRFEIYVTPFPGGGGRWLVAEGTDPSWGSGNEIFYRSGPRLMAARLDMTAGVKVVGRRVIIDPFLPPLYDDYDIHADGRTLVVVRPANRTQGREVRTVMGWFNEFDRPDR